MDHNLATKQGQTSNDLETKLITTPIVNTHCIVCGTAFQLGRMSKLYCSTRCKQFAYNHRDKIIQILETRIKGINPTPMNFLIEDYSEYNRIQKMSRRYKELDKKRSEWDAVNQEIKLSDKINMPIRDYTWNKYVSGKLTENEECEVVNIEQELDQDIVELNLKELSIEQWSFIKSLQTSLDKISFLHFASSLSKEFMDQLRMKENGDEANNQYFHIRNKFINHCNMISNGIVHFLKNDGEATMSDDE